MGTKIYIAIFDPPDSAAQILGVYNSTELAEKKIQHEISADKVYWPNYPRRYEQHRYHYEINEQFLDTGVSDDE